MRFFKTFIPLILAGLLLLAGQSCRAEKLAAWVVRFDIDNEQKVEAICRQAGQAGFDRLLVQVRGRADAYYETSLVPRAEDLEEDFDPLAEVLSSCQGMEIDAWLNVYYLWTGDQPPQDRHHPAHVKSWLLKDQQGRRLDAYSSLEQSQRWIEGIYADPASAEYRRYFSAVVAELVQRYAVGGIHLDFVRYPGAFFGAGGRLAREFQEQYGVAVSALPARLTRQDFVAWLHGSLPEKKNRLVMARLLWDYRRAAEVTELVGMVRAALDEVNPDIRLSASVFADPVDSFLDKGQDWSGWLTAGLVDELYIMNYFGDKERVQGLFNEVVELVGGRDKLWLGLASYIKSAEQVGRERALCGGEEQAVCFFSLGHFLRQGKAVRPYVEAVQGQAGQTGTDGDSGSNSAPVRALEQLKACLAGSTVESCGQGMSFVTSGSGTAAGDAGGRRGDAWLELRGIFRYVNHYDSLAKVVEQLDLARQSRLLLEAGHSFGQVAGQFSQAGSRRHGGILPRRYLDMDNHLDKILAHLEPGQISPVLAVHNGFWVYQVVAKGGADRLSDQ